MQYRQQNGVHFIRARGDMAERTRTHAVLLREQILKGAFLSLARKNESLIRKGPGLIKIPLIQSLVVHLYHKLLVPYLGSRVSKEVKKSLQAISEETGLSFEVCREILFQPDTLMLLARTSLMKHSLSEWTPGRLQGCTSAVVQKNWTKNGTLLTCRNFDYFIVGPWEAQPTVVFNEPTAHDEIPYVNITTAGVQTAGITSMNSEGLTLATHAHFGKRVSLRGQSIVLLGDEIIRKAKNLNQAVDIARRAKTYANWAFVISSGRENEGIVIEMSPNKVRVRSTEDGFLTHTNYFHSEDLRSEEALLCGSYCEDLQARLARIKELLEMNRGVLTVSHMACMMGDQTDYFTKTERVYGNTLSVITTVKSVIFEPEKQKFWMAVRNESPVSLGRYVEIDVNEFWNQSPDECESLEKSLPGYSPKSAVLLEAIHNYRNAYRSYHMNHDEPDFIKKTLFYLRKACQIFPEDGHVWLQAGLVAFKNHSFDEAYLFFEQTKACVLSYHVMYVRDLYIARCLDLVGQRSQALLIYRKHPQVEEPRLKKAYRKGLKRPYRLNETSRILIDLQFPDTFQY